MDYYKLFDKIDQAGSFNIDKLSFIALDLDISSDALEEILSDIGNEDFESLFPEVKKFSDYKGVYNLEKWEIIEMLSDMNKLGFIASVNVHQKDDFILNEDGSMSSCSVHAGISYVKYAYSDSIDGLIDEIAKVCDEMHEYDIKRFKEKSKQK